MSTYDDDIENKPCDKNKNHNYFNNNKITLIVSGWGWYLNKNDLIPYINAETFTEIFDEFVINRYGSQITGKVYYCAIIKESTTLQCLKLIKNFEVVKQNVIKILKQTYDIDIFEDISFIKEKFEF